MVALDDISSPVAGGGGIDVSWHWVSRAPCLVSRRGETILAASSEVQIENQTEEDLQTICRSCFTVILQNDQRGYLNIYMRITGAWRRRVVLDRSKLLALFPRLQCRCRARDDN